MKEALFLGVDQGTSATKWALVDPDGAMLDGTTIEVPTTTRRDGLIVQDPAALLESVRSAIEDGIRTAGNGGSTIAALGLSFQRSGVLAWDPETGNVLHPLISWKDASTKTRIDALGEKADRIQPRTGLPPNGHYAGGKIALLQQQFPASRHYVAPLDTFLLHALTRGEVFTCEETSAARTMLYDLSGGKWDPGLCELFDIDRTRLPTITHSLTRHGQYDSIPITAMIGDQQAAYWGLNAGENAAINLGSIAAVVVPTGHTAVILPGYISTVLLSESKADHVNRSFLIEGQYKECGALIDLLVHGLEVVSAPERIDEACRAALHSGKASSSAAFFPMAGTATPDWRTDLPNLFCPAVMPDADLCTLALIENLGSFLVEIIEYFAARGLIDNGSGRVLVSGGVSRIDHLLQFIADCTGLELARVVSEKGSAYGAAVLAARGYGRPIPAASLAIDHVFTPHRSKAPERYRRWLALKQRILAGDYREDEVFRMVR